jgi:hypothetical protein
MAGEWPRRWRRRRRSEPGDENAVLAPYNFWVNPALTSAARPPDLPAGLTVDEAVRISEAITAAHAESTRTMYDFAGASGSAGAPPAAPRRCPRSRR